MKHQTVKQTLIRHWFEDVEGRRMLNRSWGNREVARLCHKANLSPEELAEMIWMKSSLRSAPRKGWSGPISLHLTQLDMVCDHIRLGSPLFPIVPAFAMTDDAS